ncbi:MAG: TonB-dependent receptor [Bacteroidota bacterium]|nr:TonB-dependent receptor [Bacteroidota bacterium]
MFTIVTQTKNLIYVLLFACIPSLLFAQNTGSISGKVQDKNTQELLIGASVFLEGTTQGALTDAEGRFVIKGIIPKSYNLKIQYVGYVTKTVFNIVVTTGNIQTFNIDLEPESKSLNEVVVKTKTKNFGKKTETPLSIQNLTAEEIKSNPGGNFDISRVIQALPGVGGNTGGAAFRNDIIIRGGAPNENVFYLDGIEIPVINHFSTQGSSGGPQGILNVSFIQDVTLASSSFGAGVDNALSSVFTFKQKEGNKERLQGNLRLSASEFALTFDGPLTKNTTFLASARRSYLQFLFMAIDLPIRPNYWDFQFKTTTKINDKTTLTTLGVGAIDEFSFAVPKETSPEKEFILRNSPNINQWNYTVGAIVKRRISNGVMNISASRNMFNNRLDRWREGKTNNEEFRAFQLNSQEIENKFRLDVSKYIGTWKYSYGGMFQYVKYNNYTFNKVSVQPLISFEYASAIEFFRGGLFGEVSNRFLDGRLNLNLGLRSDVNTFTNTGLNPLRTLSPRMSASYALTEKWSLNATVGRYFKIPIYTLLGFRDNTGNFVNKNNEYIGTDHYVAGIEYLPAAATRITFETFYKNYFNYPVSLSNGISLANQGADFNVLGNEAVRSTGRGRSYGFEVFFQQKLTKNLFATLSYTWFISEFSGNNNVLVPSAWDTRQLISAIFGYKFKKGWEVGLKYRYAGGSPYTPYDMVASRASYLTSGAGVLDFNQLNTLRLTPFQQFDVRIDKKINLKRTTLDIFIDVTNATLFTSNGIPNYTFERTADNSDWKPTDGSTSVRPDGSNANPVLLENINNTVIPTFGFILEF